MKKKIFKDLFGKEIKIGDTVLNIWANNGFYRDIGQGDAGVFQYRIAKVIKFCPKSIRIEYMQNNELRDTSIFNTHNRIIIMTNKNEIINDSDMETCIKINEKKMVKLEKKLLTTQQTLNRANSKIEKKDEKINELTNTVKDLESHYARFNILDL